MNNKKQISEMSLLKEKVRVSSYLIVGMLIALLICYAMTIFVPEPYFKYRQMCFPITILVSYIASIISRKPGCIPTLYDAIELKDDKIYPTISVMFFNYISHKYTRISLLLILTSVIFSLSLFLIDINQYIISTNLIILIYSILIIFRLKLIEKRILSGAFGSNEEEALELIKFILSHSDEIDFTDGDGRPKRCFQPEQLLTLQHIHTGERVAL